MKSIVKGNDFTMRIPVVKMVEGEKVAFPLPACTDVEVRITNSYRRTNLEFTVDTAEDNVILARVEGDQLSLGTYALEVRGKIFGTDWRSNEYEQIRIVDNNASGDTVFTPDEGEDSVEMDTAVVVLPPTAELSQLISDTYTALDTAKATDETLKANEEGRVESEESRQANETARQSAENQRANTEALRIENENARIAAENQREEAEARRESDTAEAIRKAHVSVSYNAETASIDITTGE